ncbi:MAG: phosphatidylserine decarboxylase [Rickettsiaceae bacterium]|jgi:phosphatidylserine decarboxylase|nr:phosphatidylserine decarboxylase [Rickettsiaceae bacterium]
MDFDNFVKLMKDFIPPVHKEGHVFIFIFAMVSLFLWAIYSPLGFFGLVATIWCVFFFRDPVRAVPAGEGLVVSPGDGYIQKIETVSLPPELGLGDDKVTRISIFLSIFNVHVNRVPITGEVTVLNYHPGQFLSANLEKASQENERQSVVITTPKGQNIVCVQIAGLIARRIVCNLEDKQQVSAGMRYGIIRFGSRVDVYLPAGVNALVTEGQTAIGGETIFADLSSANPARKGEII